jgi:predicted RNA-binding Zn ribbon-like protein
MNDKTDPFVSRGFGDSTPWLDFVNSELLDGFGNLTDRLDDPAWVKSFLRYWRYRAPLQPALPEENFKALRSQLRHFVEKASSNGALNINQLAGLNAWLKVPVIPRLEEDQNGLHLALLPVQSGWHVVLANIASSFAEGLVQQAHNRLKICNNEDCRWIFIDATKGNVRRWCSNATCGNRYRVRRARAKQTPSKRSR